MPKPGFTDEEKSQIAEWHEAGVSGREIARRLGKDDDRAVRKVLREAKNTPDINGGTLTPTSAFEGHEAAPQGFRVRGVTTNYDGEGNIKQQWVKTWETDLWERVRAAAAAMAEELEPLAPTPAPVIFNAPNLLNQYTITDAHVGMLAWSRETGEKWDLDIAEDMLTKLFIGMIDAAPAADTGVLDQHGDFLHFDSLMPLTPTSKNLLDADSRYQKVVKVAVRILVRLVKHMLTKHKFVHVQMHEGNHDMAGSVWLRVMFEALFELEPRVRVEMSPLPYVALQHGKTMLCYHHGHLAKNAQLPLLFAAKFPRMWGDTTKRYIHVGHNHHVDEKEHPGIKVIQHPTLAAADAFAARSGYMSERQASCITYHVEFGEVGRMVWVPEMVGYESRRTDL